MLASIKVSGFKSLQSFELLIRPGLNVLIGPNGSGKSNIIDLLAFVSILSTRNVQLAVSTAGGAGAIFRKIGATTYRRLMTARLTGLIRLHDSTLTSSPEADEAEEPENASPRALVYEYDFGLKLTSDREEVYFAYQYFRALATRDLKTIGATPEWGLVIAAPEEEGGNAVPAIEKLDRRNLKGVLRESATVATITRDIDYLYAKDESILSFAARILSPGVRVLQDFSGGMVYNPRPASIRTPEDSAKPPGIRGDGSGLYATLYALRRPAAPRTLQQMRRALTPVSFRPRISLTKLEDYFRLAYPAMESFKIINDPFDNQLNIRITLAGARKTQLPLAALSDGTLKWMALITAVTTGAQIYAIEEPENFIHPRLQREAVRIIRDNISPNAFVLMSTHSETILNEAKPEEVVIVQWLKGRTSARRIRNQARMREQINKTGFGLGFFYIAGALDDA